MTSSPRRLASSSLTVAVGLTITGAGTVGMMALAVRALAPGPAASFTTWWAVATLLGTAFGVFEAFLARLVVTDLAAGRSPGRAIGVLTGRAWLVTGAMSVLVVCLSPVLATRLFGGDVGLALLLPVFLLAGSTQAIQRGAATGYAQFGAICGQLSADGVVRLLLTGILVATHSASPRTLALSTCISAASSLLIGNRLCPQWWSKPQFRDRIIPWAPIVLLLIGAVGPLVANSGPVPWLRGAGGVSDALLVAFAGAITLSRIPTQFVAAAFGPLLSQLSHAVETGDTVAFRRVRRNGDLAAGLLGFTFVVAFTVLGPRVLAAYLGPGHELPVRTLTVLAAASGLMFVAVVQQASLSALDRWGTIAAGWVLGAVALGLVLVLPLSSLTRATYAPVAAVVTALAFMAAARVLRHEKQRPVGGLTAPTDMPSGRQDPLRGAQ